jgi:hypothetical protein
MTDLAHPSARPAGDVALQQVDIPPLNPRVRHALTSLAVRHTADAHGRLLYLHRLGMVVLPHRHQAGRWACTVAAGPLDFRTLTGAFWVEDIEIEAALELLHPVHPHIDMTVGDLCAAWMVQVWDRWPGGRVAQVADALVDYVDWETCTVPVRAPWPEDLTRRAGISFTRALGGPIGELLAAGLLAPHAPTPSRALLTLPSRGIAR